MPTGFRHVLPCPSRVTVWLCGLLLVGSAAAEVGPAVTDTAVQDAVQRMRAWLYAQQDPATGSWNDGTWSEAKRQTYHETGETALIAYALLLSGESYQQPQLARAIEYLKQNRIESTYLASMRAHIWAALPDEFVPLLQQEADYLKAAEEEGRFYYHIGHPTWSNSLTQYGTLGLWEARKRGVEVPDAFWRRVGTHMVTDQQEDGGWEYNHTPARGGDDSTASMTAAGIAVLQILQQEMFRQERQPNPVMAEAIDRGVAWLNTRFDPAVNPPLGEKYLYYYLYGVERMALASGVSRLNGRDWYEAGARHILGQMAEDGSIRGRARGEMSGRIDTAFALSFLARGRVPLWVSKLRLEGVAWNQRPNDLYFLTRYLSDQREAELNWQVVGLDTPAEDWRAAPLLYLSLDEVPQLTAEQTAAIRRYLDLGGLLFINPEPRNPARLVRWAERWAAELYPDYEFEPVEAEHPFASLVTDLSGGRGRLRSQMRTLSNGVRDLIVMPRDDWGYLFQAGEAGQGEAWAYMTNLLATITDRGRLRNRLDPPLPADDPAVEVVGQVHVVKARHAGNDEAEPAAWEIAGRVLRERTGIETVVHERPLAEVDQPVAGRRADLVHVADTAATPLAEAEVAALRRYVEQGGTVLIESVGGLSEFADAAGAQLIAAGGYTRRWLGPSDPLLSGEGIDGAVDVGTFRLRAYSQLQGEAGDTPLLAAIEIDGRPAVILSPRDLSLGAIGSRYYRVNGYTPDSARRLLGNLLLLARQAGEADPAATSEEAQAEPESPEEHGAP
jgi:hypothetical protein